MKKIALFAAVVALATLGACQQKNSTPKLATDVDTLSYELGLANTVGLDTYFQQAGIDSANVKAFLKGFKEGANFGDDKEKAAYYAGIQAGMNVKGSMIPYVENKAFAGDSTQHLNFKLLMRGFNNGLKGGPIFVSGGDTLTGYAIGTDLDRRITALNAKNLEKMNPEQIKKANDFIAAKAKEEGVQKHPAGFYYKVIKEGNGIVAEEKDSCMVEYEGKLMDGVVFDTTAKPEGSKPIMLIPRHTVPGFREALKNMPVGSIWEVYIPYEMGYGAAGNANIPGFSPLTFKIQLNQVKKFVPRTLKASKPKAKVQ